MTANGFDSLAHKVGALARDLDGRSLREITGRVALEAKNDIHTEAARDLGSDRRMSGWGRFRFSAGYDLTSDHTAEIKPRPAGPWVVLERGRRGKAAGQPKRKRTKVYRTPWGLRTATKSAPFRTGGTRGHRTWTIAMRTVERETPQRIQQHARRTIARHFGRG